VLLVIYNDHVTSFFFDHYSAFALGVGEQYPVADEGGGARDLPPVAGHVALARTSARRWWPTNSTCPSSRTSRWTTAASRRCRCCARTKEGLAGVRVVPLQVGVLQFPVPSARRCYKLGQALRRAIESYPEDLRVAIVATGGLSHQVHGERAGFNNPAWDARSSTCSRRTRSAAEHDPGRVATLGGWKARRSSCGW
jgi:gallate dioxygenase